MTAEIVKIDAADPEHAFSQCRKVIRSGGVVVYPTDTFYGLGADPRNRQAVKKLFQIKGRQADQPVLLLIKDAAEAREWCDGITPLAERLMKRYWPGPLTLVFKAASHVLADLTAGTGTIGLRVPGSQLTRDLLEFIGTALTGTSANRTGTASTRSAQEAAEALGGVPDLILDGGESKAIQPSTVVNAITGQVIRQGAVKIAITDFGMPSSE